MSTKNLISTIVSIPVFIGALSAMDSELESALGKLDKSKVQCYCVCEFDGKSQLAAGTEMTRILEEKLAQNEGKDKAKLSDYIDGFIGISSGALIASNSALGRGAANIEEIIPSLKSKMIMPKCVSGCLGCIGKTTQLASYFINGVSDSDDKSKIEVEDNYDAIVMDHDSIGSISHITSGTESDLKSGLTILSMSEDPNFSEQVITAIKESDNAAKKNITKFAFDEILDAAKNITSVAIKVGGSGINKKAAEKALDIITKVGESVEKVDKVSKNDLFKQNLTKNLREPTKESPIVVIDLKAKTGDGSAIKTNMSQEISDNFVQVTYLTEIPLSMYPTKKLSFDVVKPNIKLSIKDCMQIKGYDSAKATKTLTNFLAAVKQEKGKNN